MSLSIISDLHLDPRRQGGTTMESRAELSNNLLEYIPDGPLVILGDLFDRESVSEKTLLDVYEKLKDREVVLIRGNHDSKSMKFNQISSLELLHKILPHSELVFDTPRYIGGKLFVIPHVVDQDTFNSHLKEVPDGVDLLLHCNYDNGFAVTPDHSLNLSKKQFQVLREKGCRVIMGHEHTHHVEDGLFIIGCLSPTSISDCLGGDKFYLDYDRDTGNITTIRSWSSDNFVELDYTELDKVPTDCKFVRISGECGIAEAVQVSRQVAELRKVSSAFIVKNNVRVISDETTVENVDLSSFNILDLVIEAVDKEFREEVKSCL